MSHDPHQHRAETAQQWSTGPSSVSSTQITYKHGRRWRIGWKTLECLDEKPLVLSPWPSGRQLEGAKLSWKVCAVVDYEWFTMTWEENCLLREMQRDEGKKDKRKLEAMDGTEKSTEWYHELLSSANRASSRLPQCRKAWGNGDVGWRGEEVKSTANIYIYSYRQNKHLKNVLK